MARVYLGLGSNIDPDQNLRVGLHELNRRYGNLDLSPIYRSTALGFDGDEFLNMVVGLDSDAAPQDIHAEIERIHDSVGRDRSSGRNVSRPLDIDLLLYADAILEFPRFRIPRSDVLDYSFVLRPLSELAPTLIHPETGRSIEAHWQDFDADSHPLQLVDVIL